MPQYRVIVDCYVPVGTGVRFKRAGQVVTLDSVAAADLRGHVEPAGNGKVAKVRAKRVAGAVADLNVRLASKPEGDFSGEVNQDAGESGEIAE
jgi:hypothetical protein